jgi:acyl-CoA reductase-like NAD-dependent aldehyde dehydrogenase
MGMAGFFRYLSSLDLPMRVIEDSGDRRVEAHRRPLGVIGAIIPWNYPLLILSFKLPSALLAGNTIVVKPAPTTPLSTLKFAELVKDILPKGVLNVITDANDLGDAMTKHPDIRKISFTGSTATGQKLMASAANLEADHAGIGRQRCLHRARRRRSEKGRARYLRRRVPELRTGLSRHQAALCARVGL